MKNKIKYILLIINLLNLVIWSNCAIAEIELTNALAKDIAQTYGFYLGQNYSLNEIPKKYSSLSGLAFIAEKEFSATFNSSIKSMDTLMGKYAKEEWVKIKKSISKQIENSIDINKITEQQASQFINIVRQRAKGNIDSPVLETLLLFKSGYWQRPEQEFSDGYKYKYTNNGTGKSKGVSFSIEAPKTWVAQEGNRPNIVQKFVNENGRGNEVLGILIKSMCIGSA